jgi:hypothetical protein
MAIELESHSINLRRFPSFTLRDLPLHLLEFFAAGLMNDTLCGTPVETVEH